MNKPRKSRNQRDGQESAAADSKQRGSSEFRALMAEFGRLRESLTTSSSDQQTVESALENQNQAILSIAESLADVKETLSRLRPSPEPTAASPEETPCNSDVEIAEDEETSEASVERNSDWERIREAFLTESACTELSANEPDTLNGAELSDLQASGGGETSSAEPLTADEQSLANDMAEFDAFLETLPGAITVSDTEDVVELRKLVIDRDRTISTLIQRLQNRTRREQSLSAQQLADIVEGCPEELAQRVESSLKLLNQQVRLGELELSLERARVSRQLSRLEETRSKLESNARALGLSINEDGTIAGEAELRQASGSKGRRWLGVLGFSH